MDALIASALISAGATVLSVGATAAVAIVGFRTSRSTNQATIDAARDGQVADLYGRAIEQLGSDNLEVRIGGVYALERVVRESDKYHLTVMAVLTAFIREYSKKQWPEDSREGRWTRPDIQAAVTTVGRLNGGRHDPDRPIDLYEANLTAADLRGLDLTGAILRSAILKGADLRGAILKGANLRGASLVDARRDDNTDLDDARWLRGADELKSWRLELVNITLNTYMGEWPATNERTRSIVDAALGTVPRVCPPQSVGRQHRG